MKFILLLLALITLVGCSITPPVVEIEQPLQQETIISSWAAEIPQNPIITLIDIPQTQQECMIFDDFTENVDYKWGIVNDGVMWGKSKWNLAVQDEKLIFSGTIVTRWWGFSSLRGWLERWILSEYNSVRIRAKSDGREYRITFRDNQWGNISHRLIIPFTTPWEFEEITINFTDLEPAYFGRTIKANSFEKESAREIGIILSDWVDWEFSLEIDEVSFCK
jgi:hypothetical protein